MTTLIVNARVVNRGTIADLDVLIKGGRIEKIGSDLQALSADKVVDARGCYLMPGMIDDQVHFREPGLTHKGEIATESAAAVAGGITSYMEMPNVMPPTVNADALANKFFLASQKSMANYSFYLGASHTNIDDIKSVDINRVCGVKVFMGASTGNLLVDDPIVLDAIFRECPILIATHCEDSKLIAKNYDIISRKYNSDIPMFEHPNIRDVDACYSSSSYAVDLAKKHGSNLHVLHLTTAKELSLFDVGPIEAKKITAEVCVHHLWFCDEDYTTLDSHIKCNPAIKSQTDRDALRAALLEDRIDIIATDHAPHTVAEKSNSYDEAPAGLPLVQHAMLSLLDLANQGIITLEEIVRKSSHNPALRYQVRDRGFIDEGFWADLVLVDLNGSTKVGKNNILYKCAWSPFENYIFGAKIMGTYVNGFEVYDGEEVKLGNRSAQELEFQR